MLNAYKKFRNDESLTDVLCCSEKIHDKKVCFYEDVENGNPLSAHKLEETKGCIQCKLTLHLWNGIYKTGRAGNLVMEMLATYTWLCRNEPWVLVRMEKDGAPVKVRGLV